MKNARQVPTFQAFNSKSSKFEVDSQEVDILLIKKKNCSVHLELSNFTVQGVSTFKVTGKSSKDPPAPTEINFDTPENVKLTSNYKLSGKIYEKTAHGSGSLE